MYIYIYEYEYQWKHRTHIKISITTHISIRTNANINVHIDMNKDIDASMNLDKYTIVNINTHVNKSYDSQCRVRFSHFRDHCHIMGHPTTSPSRTIGHDIRCYWDCLFLVQTIGRGPKHPIFEAPGAKSIILRVFGDQRPPKQGTRTH